MVGILFAVRTPQLKKRVVTAVLKQMKEHIHQKENASGDAQKPCDNVFAHDELLLG
jgi:hypothetical protein